MRVVYRLPCFHDLSEPAEPGDVIDAYFRSRENTYVLQAVIHYHSTHRYEPQYG